jgi:hypothetical protein
MLKNFSTIREAEKNSKIVLKNKKYQWLASGSEDNLTTEKNKNDLNKIKIYPKILRKVKNINTSLFFLGVKIPSPLVLCPMGHQTQFHRFGEIEMARAIKKVDTIGFFSTQSRNSFDDIVNKTNYQNLVWQIFPFGDKRWILNEIKRAEKNKSLAVSFCFDGLVRSSRYDDIETGYDARKFGYTKFNREQNKDFAKNYDWDFIKWVKLKTHLSIIPKGLVSISDIKKAIRAGCKSIWISNHGGRMFNSNISSVEIMINIKKSISTKFNIIVDGGVQKGSDIIKYLCLGAKVVGVGRAAIYGLSINGSKGVKRIFDILNSELQIAMINGGFKSLDDMKFSRIDCSNI